MKVTTQLRVAVGCCILYSCVMHLVMRWYVIEKNSNVTSIIDDGLNRTAGCLLLLLLLLLSWQY